MLKSNTIKNAYLMCLDVVVQVANILCANGDYDSNLRISDGIYRNCHRIGQYLSYVHWNDLEKALG